MGQRKGQTGNPEGRPKGAKNKNSAFFDCLLNHFINGGMRRFEEELAKLNGEEYVKIMAYLLVRSSTTPNYNKANEYLIKIIENYETSKQ